MLSHPHLAKGGKEKEKRRKGKKKNIPCKSYVETKHSSGGGGRKKDGSKAFRKKGLSAAGLPDYRRRKERGTAAHKITDTKRKKVLAFALLPL